MTARQHFRYPKEAVALGVILGRFHETGDVGELVNATVENEQHLEDFLRILLPADSGVVTVTSDGSGYATIIHGLTFTPRVIVASSMGPVAGGVILGAVLVDGTSITTQTFTVRLVDNTGAALLGTSGLTFGWIASR